MLMNRRMCIRRLPKATTRLCVDCADVHGQWWCIWPQYLHTHKNLTVSAQMDKIKEEAQLTGAFDA